MAIISWRSRENNEDENRKHKWVEVCRGNVVYQSENGKRVHSIGGKKAMLIGFALFIVVGILFSLILDQFLGGKSLPEPTYSALLNNRVPPSPTVSVEITPTPAGTPLVIPTIPHYTGTLDPTMIEIEQERSSGMEQIKGIIEALELYYQYNGNYPEKLDMLTPKYLTEIPVTITGQKFEYYLDGSDEYVIFFNVTRSSSPEKTAYCSFLRYMAVWECGWSRSP